jgi:hypothetical protein
VFRERTVKMRRLNLRPLFYHTGELHLVEVPAFIPLHPELHPNILCSAHIVSTRNTALTSVSTVHLSLTVS